MVIWTWNRVGQVEQRRTVQAIVVEESCSYRLRNQPTQIGEKYKRIKQVFPNKRQSQQNSFRNLNESFAEGSGEIAKKIITVNRGWLIGM